MVHTYQRNEKKYSHPLKNRQEEQTSFTTTHENKQVFQTRGSLEVRYNNTEESVLYHKRKQCIY